MTIKAEIIGVGMARHGYRADRGWRDLVFEAGSGALADAGIERSMIDGGLVSVTCPEAFEQQNLGPLTAEELDLPSGPFAQVVGACAGGTMAFMQGVNMIRSGQSECVIVVGVEKMSDVYSVSDALLSYPDQDYEAPAGFDYVDTMALMHARYMQKYGVAPEHVSAFAMQDRWYASRNPKAIDYRRGALGIDEIMQSGWASRPITRAECARGCDGAAAVILARADGDASRRRAVQVASITAATGPNAMGAKFGAWPGEDDIAEAVPTRIAAERAYREAGITARDVDVAQVHDCFSVMGSLHLEGLGIFPRGEAARAVASGETALGGTCPTNTDGGRIGLGHPTGATGISIVCETVTQLRGEAGERQVAGARVGVAQSMGGNNAVSAVAVLKGN